MLWLESNWERFVFELVTYILIENVTKYILGRFRDGYRFNILVLECFTMGLVIGFLSCMHYIPWVLITLLCFHVVGIMYTHNILTCFIDSLKYVIKCTTRGIVYILPNMFTRKKIKQTEPKSIPTKYLYNFHLKPTNDLRLQQTSLNKSLPRPGMLNSNGNICAFNSLIQSLASLDSFCIPFKRNLNTSRFNYDSLIFTFNELILQLRNEYLLSDAQKRQNFVDGSYFIGQLKAVYPNLLANCILTDICELFQALVDILNQSLSKDKISTYSNNVIEQVQNTKLTTLSLAQLNKVFNETESLSHDTITLENLDTQASLIIQYIDVTWLLHHIQMGSTVKQTFSGQILHANCCSNCSHLRFRTEPFQILPISIPTSGGKTLHSLISQFTRIDIVNSVVCSLCSSPPINDASTPNRFSTNGNLLGSISSALSPIVSSRCQPSDQIFASTPISNTNGFIPPVRSKPVTSTMKSQMMIANLPEVLCLQLKRFAFDRLSQQAVKLTTPVLIEAEKVLDLSTIHYTTWLGLESSSIPSRYQLRAICLHLSGQRANTGVSKVEARNGHCVCLYRSSQNRWFLCDDERITEITNVDHFFQTPYVTENCYLLFYERC